MKGRGDDVRLSPADLRILSGIWDGLSRQDEVGFRTVGSAGNRHVIPVQEGESSSGQPTVQPMERGASGTWKPDPDQPATPQTPAQQARSQAVKGQIEAGGDKAPIPATRSTPEHEKSEALTRSLIGRIFRNPALTPDHLVTLTGAGEGARATFRKGERGLEVEIVHRDYRMTREFYRSGSKLICENHFFGLNEDARGRGAAIFARQVDHLRAAGVDEVRTLAYRDDTRGIVGYAVWPRLGYDGPLEGDLRRSLPADLKTARRLSDLMWTPAGRAWWTEHGDGVHLTFDLSPDSLSSRVLTAYRTEKAKAGPQPHHKAALEAHDRTRQSGRATSQGTPERELATRQHAQTTRHLITLAEEVHGRPLEGETGERAKQARRILEMKGDAMKKDVDFITLKGKSGEGNVIPVSIEPGSGGHERHEMKRVGGKWIKSGQKVKMTHEQVKKHIEIRRKILSNTKDPDKKAAHEKAIGELEGQAGWANTPTGSDNRLRQAQHVKAAGMAIQAHQRVLRRGADPVKAAQEITSTAQMLTGKAPQGEGDISRVRNAIEAIHVWLEREDPDNPWNGARASSRKTEQFARYKKGDTAEPDKEKGGDQIEIDPEDEKILDTIWSSLNDGQNGGKQDATGFITVKKGEEEGKVVPVQITSNPRTGQVQRQLMERSGRRWVTSRTEPARQMTPEQVQRHIAVRTQIAQTTTHPAKRARHQAEVARLRREVQTGPSATKSGMPASGRPPVPPQPTQAATPPPVQVQAPVMSPPVPVQAQHPDLPDRGNSPSITRIKPVRGDIDTSYWIRKEDADRHLAVIFGTGTTHDRVAALSGSHDATSYTIKPHGRYGCVVNVQHPDYTMTRTFRKEGNKIICHNDYFRAYRPGSGNSKVFAQQVFNLQAAGVSHIETDAARSDGPGGYNGYYTWPRLGYDVSIEKASKYASVPASLGPIRRVSDLMKTEEGRAWWKENGGWTAMEFDLKADSQSMKVLTAYAQAKGYPVPGDATSTSEQPAAQPRRPRAPSKATTPSGRYENTPEGRRAALAEYEAARQQNRNSIAGSTATQQAGARNMARVIRGMGKLANQIAGRSGSSHMTLQEMVRTVHGADQNKQSLGEKSASTEERFTALQQYAAANRAYEAADYPGPYDDPDLHEKLSVSRRNLHVLAERMSGAPLTGTSGVRTAQALRIIKGTA